MVGLIRYGFIGCGMMGQEHLRNLAMIEGTEVTVIYEPDSEMREKTSLLSPQSRFVETVDDVIQSGDIDALIITSPNHRHAEQLLNIASIRPLPVLVEKPVCTNLEQLRSLQRLAESYPETIWVAMEYRYMPPISRLAEEAHSGNRLGRITSLSIREHRYPFLSLSLIHIWTLPTILLV